MKPFTIRSVLYGSVIVALTMLVSHVGWDKPIQLARYAWWFPLRRAQA
jgi:hypothetical protein